jgi:3-dehydroquinate synthase
VTTIPVALGARSYDVRIEPGLLARAGEVLAPLSRDRPMPIITDANLAAHCEALVASLAAAGITAPVRVLPAGESTKSW